MEYQFKNCKQINYGSIFFTFIKEWLIGLKKFELLNLLDLKKLKMYNIIYIVGKDKLKSGSVLTVGQYLQSTNKQNNMTYKAIV